MLKNDFTYPDKDLLHRVRPNLKPEDVLGYTGINSMGFRCQEFDFSSKTSHLKKIMILGDSCSFMWGVKNYNDTFTNLLEEKLNEKSQEYRIYNLSQPGYSSHQASLLFERWFEKINPNILIFCLGWNDLWPTPLLTDKQTIRMLKMSNNPLMKIVRKSHTSQFISFLIQRNTKKESSLKKRTQRRVPMKESLANYKKMISFAKKRNARVIFILQPFSTSFSAPFPGLNKYLIEEMLKYQKACRVSLNRDVIFIELEKMLYVNPDASIYFINDGYHPNPRGSRYIFEKLYKAISEI